MMTKQAPKRLGRKYRVLNLEPSLPLYMPTCGPRTPVVMSNDVRQWCLTEAEAIALAASAEQRGYRVEIVSAVD